MKLGRALKDKLMDVRLRDKLITEGKITKEEVESYLKSLDDDENNLTYSNVETKTDLAESPEENLEENL